VVAEYERSGRSRRGCCERTGVATSTLDYWRRQVREGNRARIVPVKIEAAEGAIRRGPMPGIWEFPEQALARLPRVAAERWMFGGLGPATRIYVGLEAVDMRKYVPSIVMWSH